MSRTATLALVAGGAQAQPSPSTSATTAYHTVAVDGVTMFYREAGPPDAPTVLLLHGYPSSSRMFATLIPLLADRYHLIAPDYPGFGQSDAPAASEWASKVGNLLSRSVLPDMFLDIFGRPPWAARRHARSETTGLA